MFAARFFGLLPACGLVVLAGSAIAAGSHGGTPWFQGQMAFATPACPGISYHFALGAGAKKGYAWFNDGNGASSATGTIDPASGEMHLILASVDGKGPQGTLDGVKGSDDSLKAQLNRPGCAPAALTYTAPTGYEPDQH